MQQDDVIWSVINDSFCSFKTSFNKTKFCRNEYNVTGVCNKVSCPLANSRYATIREEDGLWEKVKLDGNFMTAIEQIDKNLEYWPGHMVHRVKQRYIKITQYLIRMRKLRKQVKRELVPIKKKTDRRDAAREMKAMVAAQLTVNIKKELLERLKKQTYGDLYYFPEKVFNDVMEDVGEPDQMNEEEVEEEDGDLEGAQFVEGDSDEESYDEEDSEYNEELERELDMEAMNGDMEDYEEEDGDDDEDDDEDEDDSDEDDYQPSNKNNNNKRPTSKSQKKDGSKPTKARVEIEPIGPLNQDPLGLGLGSDSPEFHFVESS
eukprot:gene12601-14787_t